MSHEIGRIASMVTEMEICDPGASQFEDGSAVSSISGIYSSGGSGGVLALLFCSQIHPT